MREGWQQKKLVEVCQIRPPKKEAKDLLAQNDFVSFVPMKTLNINQKYFDSDEKKLLSEVSSSYTYFKNDDVLLAKITPCFENGKLGIAKNLINGIGFGSSEYIIYRSKKNIKPEFLYYYLNQEEFRARGKMNMTGAVGHKRISKEFYEDSIIPIPPLEEQKQIVTILDEAFTAIDQAKANIEKNIINAKELFDSKKEQVFINLSLESELMPILDTCKKMFAGGDKPKPNFSKFKTEKYKIPVVSNGEKNNGIFGYTDKAKVKEPSITISARGTIGFTVFRDYSFLPIVRLIVLTPNLDLVFPEFLIHAIKSLDILKSGSSIPQLTVPMMKGYSLPIPSKKKQLEVIKQLNSLESKLKNYEIKLANKIIDLEELKKSILQKAFTGELTQKEVLV